MLFCCEFIKEKFWVVTKFSDKKEIPVSVIKNVSIFIVDMYVDKYWDEGWYEFYRIFAILGFIILCISIYGIFQLPPQSLKRSSTPNKIEIVLWVIAIIFGIIFNIVIVGLK
ncbi:hypothetical protein ES705_49242 [subsurface metagenome]